MRNCAGRAPIPELMVKAITPGRPQGPAGTEPGRGSKAAAARRAEALPREVDARPFFAQEPTPTFETLPRYVHSTTGASSLSPAVRAVTLAGLGATVVVGLPMVAHAQDVPPSGELTRAEVEREIGRLENRRHELSPEELDAERARLWQLYVRAGGPAADGLPNLTTTSSEVAETTGKSRGELRMERLARDIEFEMRITARDMAHGNFTAIEGMPGYKELSEDRVRDLISDAIKDIPLSELPGGGLLAALVHELPNTAHLRPEGMTYRELERAVGDAQKEWLKDKFGPFLEEHKIEAAVVAFGSITAIRYTSPEAARTMDKFFPRIGVYDRSFLDNRVRVDADLKYRNAEVLPNLDIGVRARQPINDNLTARLDAEGRLSVEADRLVSGRVSGGLRYTEGRTWADGSLYVTDTGRYGIELESGTSHLETGLNARAHVGAHFGEGTTTGDASGRVLYGVDLTRDVNINGAKGNFGVYVGGGVDTDGRNNDVRAGVIFTLRW